MSRGRCLLACAALPWLVSCASPPPAPSTQHLAPAPPVTGKAPDFVAVPAMPKPPKPTAKPELYSVVVHNMEVQDLLFALARDAKVNVSVHPAISGMITMSVIDQTLPEILDVIAEQVDMRYEIKGKALSIQPDLPYLKMYRIDYPNIARNASSSVSISTNVASTGSAGGSGGTGSNASDTTVRNTANNQFWETIIANLRDLLRETDRRGTGDGASGDPTGSTSAGGSTAPPRPAPPPATPATAIASAVPPAPTSASQGTATTAPGLATAPGAPRVQATGAPAATPVPVPYRDTASVIANPENGVINVRATQRQHEKVREFLDGIMDNARRQVMIEATIVEVDLSDRYQQGIDWSMLRTSGNGFGGHGPGSGIALAPTGPSSALATGGVLGGLATLTWQEVGPSYTLAAALRLLESFGTLRVLSSPKLSVLNSQTSILKVVDNEVYFTVSVTPGTAATATTAATPATYTSTINTVPIGFLMTVTPQISRHGEVILNLRPTISRISRFASDPNPDLARNGVINQIPVVQSREMESILRVQSGDIAVLGGLIQDSRDRKIDAIPFASNIPLVGDLLSYRDNKSRKTELVIFLRPTVLNDASLEGDFQGFRGVIPQARNALTQPADQDKPEPRR